MNANELADALVNTDYTPLKAECATMLRTIPALQAEIEALKTDLLFFQKEKSKEELKLAARYFELTDEEIIELFESCGYPNTMTGIKKFARAILRKASEK